MIETYTPDLFAPQWPEVTKPTDGASAVWRKKRPDRKRVDDDDDDGFYWTQALHWDSNHNIFSQMLWLAKYTL